jgi:hypothetical protein
VLLQFATATATEQATRDAAPDAQDEQDEQDALVAAVRGVSPQSHPRLTALSDELFSGMAEDRLNWGFHVLVNGILQTGRPDAPEDHSPVWGTLPTPTSAYLRLLDRLEVTAAAVLGSSCGGWIAAEMCARDRERRLTRLLLLEVPQNQASAAPARWASSAVRNCSGWSRCGAWPESGITISV